MTTSFKNVVNHCVVYCVFAAIVLASSKFVAHMLIKSSNLDSAQMLMIEPPTSSNTQIVRFDYSCDIQRTFVTCLIEYLAFALVLWICSYLPCIMKNKTEVAENDTDIVLFHSALFSESFSASSSASSSPPSNASIAAIDPDSDYPPSARMAPRSSSDP